MLQEWWQPHGMMLGELPPFYYYYEQDHGRKKKKYSSINWVLGQAESHLFAVEWFRLSPAQTGLNPQGPAEQEDVPWCPPTHSRPCES